MITTFGKNGIVDLKEGAVFGAGQPIDLEPGEIGVFDADDRLERQRSTGRAGTSADTPSAPPDSTSACQWAASCP